MLDSLESFVRNHYISTAWNEDRHYSNITASSRAILDFEVPRGIELRLGKSLSPYFRTAYSWGIIPDRKSFGVIFSNVSSLDTLRWPIARAGGAGAGSVTEDIQTRLGLSWREAVQHYDHVKHLPKDSHGDSKIRRDDALWPKKTSRSRDAAPSVWSWERMVALATGQPVDQRQIHNDQLGDRADSASQITSETLASLSAIGAARGPRQTNDHVPSLGNKKASPRDTLLYGQLLQDGSIDFQYSQRLHRNWLAIASGRSAWQYANSHLFAQIMYNPSPTVCTEMSFDSDGQIFGWSSLATFQSPFGENKPFSKVSVGGEIYYGAKEKTGGLSFGFRLRQFYPQFKPSNASPIHSTFTTLLNPMMGHVSMAYVSTVKNGMDFACRYDLNLYSVESDLSIGVEYAPPNREQVLKARWSLGEGLAFLLEGKWNRAIFSLGLNLQLQGATEASAPWDRGLVSASPKLGIQIQI